MQVLHASCTTYEVYEVAASQEIYNNASSVCHGLISQPSKQVAPSQGPEG